MHLTGAYPIGEQIAASPIVQVIDEYISIDDCRHIIQLSADRLDAALVSAVGEATTSDGRTGRVAWIKHDETQPIRSLVERVSELVGIPAQHAESLQVVHYEATEQYKPHFDAYDLNTEKGRQRTAKGGQRLVTALLYLNEVEAGGGTIFPRLGIEIDARPGRMVIFHNVADATLTDLTRHPDSLHGGAPVEAGQKWACNLWFRLLPYR